MLCVDHGCAWFGVCVRMLLIMYVVVSMMCDVWCCVYDVWCVWCIV